jgi:hypothetical protein
MSFVFTKQKVNKIDYHHYYSPTSSGGSRATKEGACNASESKVTRTQV